MRIKIDGHKVFFYKDEGSYSCGESRPDWVYLGFVPTYDLIKALEAAVKENKVVRLDA